MEVIRGRESDCRQEIRSAVERGGTRPTRRVDPQRQAFRPVAGEGPHPAEGGRIGTRRRLERQPDCRGAGEAKLIALTLSPAPEGFARWSLRLLEEKVVELHIVERASDNTIGRTLKKTFSNRIAGSNG